MTNNIKNFKVR